MKEFEVILKIHLPADRVFEKFLEIAADEEYEKLQKKLYGAVTEKFVKKKTGASKVTVEKDADKTLTVTCDRKFYYERTVYDLQTKDFEWKMVVRGMEKAVRMSSTGSIKADGDATLYSEKTRIDIRVPLLGIMAEAAVRAAVDKDVESKKKYYEKKFKAPIEVVSII